MHQLFNSNGTLFSYQEFLRRYQIPVTPKQFAIVFDAIPSGVSMLFRGCMSASVSSVPSTDVTDSPIGKVCFNSSGSKNNRKIRVLFQSNTVSASPGILV